MDEDRVMKDFLRWCSENNGPMGVMYHWVNEYLERRRP